MKTADTNALHAVVLMLSNQGRPGDDEMVMAMGYKPELKRGYNMFTVFSVSFSLLGILPNVAACMWYQQGSVGMLLLPWIVAVVLVTLVSLSLAEVASAYPCSSGSPFAVLQLAPKKYKTVLTWIGCWSQFLCQITAFPAVNYATAQMILACKVYMDPEYSPQTWQTFLLTVGISVSHSVLAALPTSWIAHFFTAGSLSNITFFIIVFVMILAGNKRLDMYDDIPKFNSNSKAWSLENFTDFPQGIAFMQAFLGCLWGFSGSDAPYHMAEECRDAATAVPQAMVLTAVAGGAFGWILCIAMSYVAVDTALIFEDPDGLGQPFITFFTQFLDRKMVLAALALTIICSYFSGAACTLSALRVTWLYLRDHLFPLSKYWKIVDPRIHTPVMAIIINLVVGSLLNLLMFAGDVAIGAIFSVGAIAGFVSFTMPSLLKITTARKTFVPGPFNLGKWSTPVAAISVAFVTVMIPILCFPSVSGANLDAETMNWTVLVYFGPIVLSLVYYYVLARKWYVGPKSNLEDPEASSVEEQVEVLEMKD